MPPAYAAVNRPSALLSQHPNFYWLAFGVLIWNFVMLAVWWRWFQQGQALRLIPLMWCFSIVPMALLGWLVEGRSVFGDILNPSRASWMFVFGDLVGLPLAGYFLCRYAQTVEAAPEWVTSATAFWLIALGGGLATGLCFHFVMEASVYTPEAFNSPTKIYHDFGAYVLFGGAMIYGAVYMITAELRADSSRPWWMLAVVASVAMLWGSFMIHDSKHLDPRELHVRYDWRTLSALQ